MPGRVRCPACRSSVSLSLVWAAGDACPLCSSALLTGAAHQRVLGRPVRPAHAQRDRAAAGSNAPRDREPSTEPQTRQQDEHDRHAVAIATSLRYAEESAADGDYADALGWLDVVEYTTGHLPRPFPDRRSLWEGLLAAEGRGR